MSQSTVSQLRPLAPNSALEMYFQQREKEVSDATYQSHQYRLNHFARWSDEVGLDNMNDLTGRKLHEYRLWRRRDGDLNSVSVRTQMSTLRTFIRFCERIDAVPDGLHKRVDIPTINGDDGSRESMLDPDDAAQIIDYHRKFEYASGQHVVVELLWRTGIRIGSLRALDVGDYDPRERSLELVHRPETDTPLKNQSGGERFISVRPSVCDLLDDWIEHQRPETTDDYGREPLITSQHGRMHTSNLRVLVYCATRPCVYAECPKDRNPNECEAARRMDKASSCPVNSPPHDLRRGAITNMLRQEVPIDAVSDRVNAGRDVLETHYSQLTEREKMLQRRTLFDEL